MRTHIWSKRNCWNLVKQVLTFMVDNIFIISVLHMIDDINALARNTRENRKINVRLIGYS